MKFHLNVLRAPRGRWDVYRYTFLLATMVACAALFILSQSANQASAQSRFERDGADHSTKPAQDAARATPQASAAIATLADADVLASVPDAPIPQMEMASLTSPASNQFFSLAVEGGQSSSSQNLPPENSSSTAPPAQPRVVKTKSPHHGLGVALAIVGSAALAVGVASYALSGIDVCANDKSGGCKEARDAGLVLMPVGGGVAFTGFYLVFHH
jgi:hypothetical protein